MVKGSSLGKGAPQSVSISSGRAIAGLTLKRPALRQPPEPLRRSQSFQVHSESTRPACTKAGARPLAVAPGGTSKTRGSASAGFMGVLALSSMTKQPRGAKAKARSMARSVTCRLFARS